MHDAVANNLEEWAVFCNAAVYKGSDVNMASNIRELLHLKLPGVYQNSQIASRATILVYAQKLQVQ